MERILVASAKEINKPSEFVNDRTQSISPGGRPYRLMPRASNLMCYFEAQYDRSWVTRRCPVSSEGGIVCTPENR